MYLLHRYNNWDGPCIVDASSKRISPPSFPGLSPHPQHSPNSSSLQSIPHMCIKSVITVLFNFTSDHRAHPATQYAIAVWCMIEVHFPPHDRHRNAVSLSSFRGSFFLSPPSTFYVKDIICVCRVVRT